jgi:hypothetical protein
MAIVWHTPFGVDQYAAAGPSLDVPRFACPGCGEPVGYWGCCAARRLLVSPAQPGRTQREVLGPMADFEPRGDGDNSMPLN